jgi:hypothetical protein
MPTNHGGWSKKPLLVMDKPGNGSRPTARLSVVFTWHLAQARQQAEQLKRLGARVIAGGPAVLLMPEALAGLAEIGADWPGALQRHNPQATRTSTGCPRRCPFCAVPLIEGEIRELADWQPRPIVCDNNLLATSRSHFDRVIDSLKRLKTRVDFNAGLDARLLTPYHAGRLAELDCLARLSWDYTNLETAVMAAIHNLRNAGFPKRNIRVYCLIGYDDTPDDALHRLETIRNMGHFPVPMRFNPLNAAERDAYVHPAWTDAELRCMVRYFSNLHLTRGLPYHLLREVSCPPPPT